MWDTLLNNIPTTICILLAAFICGTELYKNIKVWKEAHKKRLDAQLEEREEQLNIQKEFQKIHDRFDQMDCKIESMGGRQETIENRVQDLIESDKNDIKAWIVEQYHKFYIHQGWIDAFSAETIERRYSDYRKEGGNSYIEQLMERLRSLPMDPEDVDRHEY